MRYMRVLVLSFMVTTIVPLPVPAQTNSQDNAARAKLEEQLWQIEQDWLKAEHDQKMDSLRDLWTDQFFDILPGGVQITKQAMLKRLAAGTSLGLGISDLHEKPSPCANGRAHRLPADSQILGCLG